MLKRLKMFQGTVALVFVKTVLGIARVIGNHDSIPVDLRHHRGGRDAPADLVALYEASLGNVDGDWVYAVNEKKVGPRIQGQDGPFHRFKGSVENVELVDVSVRSHADADGRRRPCNERKGLLPRLGSHLFRIANPIKAGVGRKNNRRGHDRPGKRPAPRLINPRNDGIPCLSSRLLVEERIERLKGFGEKG